MPTPKIITKTADAQVGRLKVGFYTAKHQGGSLCFASEEFQAACRKLRSRDHEHFYEVFATTDGLKTIPRTSAADDHIANEDALEYGDF